MQNKKIVIIGAGPTGLGAGYRLKEVGYKNFIIYEKNMYAGGLCASFKDNNGFTWDLGGHVIFSEFEYFNKLLEKILNSAYLEHKRKAWIRKMNRWIPYPFQNNIKFLPDNIMKECLLGLKRSNQQNRKSTNFKEWIINNFGEGIAKYFFLPYNSKVWAYPLDKLSTSWVKDRISKIESKDIHSLIASDEEITEWGPNAVFKYPLHSGVGEIFRRMATYLNGKIRYGSEIISIDSKQKNIYLSNGRKDAYDILINTAPIDRFLKLIKFRKKKILEISLNLKHNGVFIVGIGINKACPTDKCWIYFPDSNSPFFRVTYLSNYSPYNVPDSKEYYSLLCESSYSEYKKESKSKIIENTIQGLISSGLINKADEGFIVSKFLFDIDYAYPIPTIKRDEALKEIQPTLEKMNIYSRGRFGAWKYEIGNTDHSVMQGKEVVDRILGKDSEYLWHI